MLHFSWSWQGIPVKVFLLFCFYFTIWFNFFECPVFIEYFTTLKKTLSFHLIPMFKRNPSKLADVWHVYKQSIHLFSIVGLQRCARPCPSCQRANKVQGDNRDETPIHCSGARELRESTQTQDQHVYSTEKDPRSRIKPATFCKRDSADHCNTVDSSAHIIINKAENYKLPL